MICHGRGMFSYRSTTHYAEQNFVNTLTSSHVIQKESFYALEMLPSA
jgi:hypothetical protein